jgi:hypothetical protein
MYTGEICYLTPPDDSVAPTTKTFCAQDADPVDGIPDDADLNGIPDVLQPMPDTLTCPAGFVEVALDVYCVSYAENPEWVFNLADLVDYFWQLTDQGVKLLQVRFYLITQ